jgi:hypothetical protein
MARPLKTKKSRAFMFEEVDFPSGVLQVLLEVESRA